MIECSKCLEWCHRIFERITDEALANESEDGITDDVAAFKELE